ncbi:MAG TPA: ATP-binding protein [Tepidisphaeraceae bacterium]|jgi:signal transduction histidine kinase|nr:ATP-binding protein [Tepidisphaeraceae bacterium]
MTADSTILEQPAAPAALSRQDYARRVDELGAIIIKYSEIAERLQQSHEQLTATVLRLRAELSEKNKMLERKNRLAALGEMAAGMAHEIRNPLGGIQLYASLLAKDVADRPASHDLVRKISGGVKRMEGIVGQVLQFTRELHVQPAAVDLAEVVAQAVEYAAHAMAERGVSCAVDGPAALPVKVDPMLFGQAVLNLLLNAAEAIEKPGGRVRISYGAPPVGSEAKQFHLTVVDNGPGISPGAIDKIFNPFFTTKDTGTGLGLAIVHRVIEAHDGAIVARNDADGGARFEVRI